MSEISKKELDEYFDDYQENVNYPASREVHKTYKKHNDALNDYINAVCEDSWKCGFKYAVKLTKEGLL